MRRTWNAREQIRSPGCLAVLQHRMHFVRADPIGAVKGWGSPLCAWGHWARASSPGSHGHEDWAIDLENN